MGNKQEKLGEVCVELMALARKLEGEGQYNNAKLTRAVIDSLLRKNAYGQVLPSQIDKLAAQLNRVSSQLSELGLEMNLVEALKRGAAVMGEGRLPMIEDTPNPYVCRTCGHVEMKFPEANCPICNAQPFTFHRYPPVYWLEAMDPFESLTWLRKTPETVEQLIAGLSEDNLSQEPFAGEWSIRNVLSHLRDAQGVLEYRLNLLLSEENPVIESKAVFEWARDESSRPVGALEIFDTYLSSRQRTLERLDATPLIDWWREGRHEEFGLITVNQQVSYFATHELTHLPQIDANRQALHLD